MGTNTTWYCSNSNHFQPFSALAPNRRRTPRQGNSQIANSQAYKQLFSWFLLCLSDRESQTHAYNRSLTILYVFPTLCPTLEMYSYHLFDAFIALLCFSANIGLTERRLSNKMSSFCGNTCSGDRFVWNGLYCLPEKK